MSFPLLASAALSTPPPFWLITPFIVLLLCIALMPMIASHFWEKAYPWISLSLGALTAGIYAFMLHRTAPLSHAVMEYISFMSLVGALFVISGGINIRVKGSANPLTNVLFLAVGAVLSNAIGTTGASMLLIRPWIRMNKIRMNPTHVVFFIFIISNCGGALTPIGDPPLFIGYLRGVPFWWVLQQAWLPWLTCVGLLLTLFFILDTLSYRKAEHAVPEVLHDEATPTFRGLWNVLPLLAVLLSVFVDQQLHWGPFTLTAGIMILAAALSYLLTDKTLHQANDFHFGPVKEVGWLFIGIFLTMIPALELLQSGQVLQLQGGMNYYLASGSLSAFLDNAPTYMAFLATAMGHYTLDVNLPSDVQRMVTQDPVLVLAISMGAVFFGAGSYIGNGPNFMVKAIAEKAGVRTPSFLGYLFRYSLPLLIPVLVLVGCMKFLWHWI
jgi:Na+/H+ antiporter NhaD/arsenite permease-like protein